MKKKIQKAKRVATQVFCMGMLLVFLSAFIKVGSKKVAILDSLPKDYTEEFLKDADISMKPKLSEYDWYFSIYLVYYTDTNGWVTNKDTVIVPPGTVVKLENVSYYESCIKITDNFMLNFTKGHYFGEWIPNIKEVPKDKVPVFAGLRMLDDFKPEERFVFVRQKEKTREEHYFETMRDVSRGVDGVTKKFFDSIAIPLPRELASRRNVPKQRPLLTYAAFRACGGIGDIRELCAVSELHTLSLYCYNSVFDNKLSHDKTHLTLGAIGFDEMTTELICSLPISKTKQLGLLHKLSETNKAVARGNYLDTQILRLERIQEFETGVAYTIPSKEFLSLYAERCQMFAAPDAFSLWAGGYVAGANPEQLAALWRIGLWLGEGLQSINDYWDTSSENPHRLKDLKECKLTLPTLWYLWNQKAQREHLWHIDARETLLGRNHLLKNNIHTYCEYLLPPGPGTDLIREASTILVTSSLFA